MKYKDFLNEMPRIILPLKNSKTKVQLAWSKVNKTEMVEITEFPLDDYQLFEHNNQFFLVKDDYCSYYVNLENLILLNSKSIRQVYVWRDSNKALPGIASLIFWKILFVRYSCIATDVEQTIDGKDFWVRRIQDSFDKLFKVILLNTKTNKSKELKDMKDVYQEKTNIWGSSSKHQNTIILICKN